MPKPTLSKISSQHGQILVRDNAGQHHCGCPGLSENPEAHSTPPCPAPTGLEPGGAVVVLASYKAYDSTPLAKSSMSEHRAIPSGRASSSHSAGASSGRNGLRNTTHPLTPSVTASVRAKSSAVISSISTDARDRNTSARRMTTPTVSPVPPSSGTSPPNSTVFTGAGAQNLGMSAVVGGAILLSFLWFL
ncbi:hypothetical protein ASPSYDRAFT_713930 [Aspergillus sydowii CBS 593.65]|uniref:Uncharacterized protein n=1 Tax=Aspergillus sydowii CBS 593.65 TaxID=1036612 RepID=A0A1L9SYL2_9EURO|nr:uncharacterized protein ASPSYDRAFT_713930 [Aspergillus sydowii CBS 593.65]OJJ52123.1 hypothetical protein ASPSYDRAFT_713930 [Aspergillus sydowii CBS 593.65]